MNVYNIPVVDKDKIIFKKVQDGILIVSLVNEPAAILLEDEYSYVWSLIDGIKNIERISQELSKKYKHNNISDIFKILSKLQNNNLILFSGVK